MLLVTKIILIVVALGGLTYALVKILHRDRTSQSIFAKPEWRRIGFGVWTFWGALIDLILVFLGYAGSFEALVGIVMYVSLGYAMSLVDLDDFFKQLGNIGDKSGR